MWHWKEFAFNLWVHTMNHFVRKEDTIISEGFKKFHFRENLGRISRLNVTSFW